MADKSLEERLNAFPNNESKLEKTIEKEEKSDWTFKNMLWDGIKYAPLAGLAYLIGGAASFLTPIGLGIGKLIANRKKKKKTTWSEMRKTLAVGNFGGALAYWAYSIPDMIIGAPVSFIGKIAKTLLFNPLMTAPWIAWYRTTSYIVDKYGGWGLIKSLFNFKIFRYAKEAYDNDIKGKYWSNVSETFLTLAPIHFFSMNYVANPTYRVGIGAVNDVLFSMIAGEEGLLKTIYGKVAGRRKEKYAGLPSYKPAPAYSPA